ncbi:MAG: hypothetical protein U0235_26455 [Polyangiaceae bacterium]
MVEKHSRRLRVLFGALLASVAPAALASACGKDGASTTTEIDAAADGTVEPTVDAATETDANGAADGAADASDGAMDAAAEARSCVEIIEVLDAGPDVDPPCALTLPCGLPARIFPIGCELYHEEPDDAAPTPIGCVLVEEAGCTNGVATMIDGGPVGTRCLDCPAGAGRHTAGVRAPTVACTDATAAYFARMAHGEAASVFAFERLARELAAHGAPQALRAAAERAARDERRHARAMKTLATRTGARVPAVRHRVRGGTRRLGRVAAENVAEGCVREAFGALLLAYQARAAHDPAHRRAFAMLARDERRHAALAAAIDEWSASTLDARARRRTVRVREEALDALERELTARAAEEATALGLPSRDVALRLFAGFAASLRSAA